MNISSCLPISIVHIPEDLDLQWHHCENLKS